MAYEIRQPVNTGDDAAKEASPLTYREKIAGAVAEFKNAMAAAGPSREASIAATHLETAQLWALKAAE